MADSKGPQLGMTSNNASMGESSRSAAAAVNRNDPTNRVGPSLKKLASRATEEGTTYEYSLAALFLARLVHHRSQNPHLKLQYDIWTNVSMLHPFDDLVVRLLWDESGERRGMLYCLQVKQAQKSGKRVPEKTFVKPSGYFRRNFSHCKKLLEIHAKEDPDEDELLIREIPMENWRFVDFTTDKIMSSNKLPRSPLPLEFPFKEIFQTGKVEPFSFGPEDELIWNMQKNEEDEDTFQKEYLPRVVIFNEQASVQKFKEQLTVALEEVIRSPLARPESFREKYIDRLRIWWRRNKVCALTESSHIIQEVLSEDIMKNNSKNRNVVFQDTSCKNLAQWLSNTQVGYVIVPGITRRIRCSKLIQAIEMNNKETESEQPRYISLSATFFEEYNEETLKFLLHNYVNILIINLKDYENDESTRLQKVIIDHCKDVKVFVVSIDSVPRDLQFLSDTASTVEDKWTMDQLLDEDQNKVLSRNVIFQGHNQKLEELKTAWPSMSQTIHGAMLAALINGDKVTVGCPLPQVDKNYIPRSLEHSTVLQDRLFDLRSPRDHFMLRAFPEETLKRLRARDSHWKECLLSEVLHANESNEQFMQKHGSEFPNATKWSVWTSGASSKKLDESKIVNVHWLTWEKEEIIWNNTNGSFEAVSVYVKKKSEKCETKHLCSHSNSLDFVNWRCTTTLLAGHAGVGKSTFVIKMANTIKEEKKSHWVVVVRVSEGKAIEKLPEKLELAHIVDVLQLSASGVHAMDSETRDIVYKRFGVHVIETEKQFLKECVEGSGNITVFVDGVDEICPAHKAKVLGFVEKLREALEKSGGRLWVTGRSVLEEDLARTLRCATPLALRPFSREDQQRYLLAAWRSKVQSVDEAELEGRVGALVDALREATASGGSSLCDVPLYTRMLAEAYQGKELEELLRRDNVDLRSRVNRFDLYKRFIRKTLSTLWAKVGIPESDHTNPNITSSKNLKKHSQYAVLEFFNEEMLGKFYPTLQKSLKELEKKDKAEEMARTGIITRVVDGKPSFLHYSIAEYLAAYWLQNNYKSLPELTEALYGVEFREIRYFFDALLAESFPLHEAALAGRAAAIEAALKNKRQRDKGGRRALHLAAIYRREWAVKVLLQHGAAVNATDNVMNRTPLAYLNAMQPLHNNHWNSETPQIRDTFVQRLTIAEQLLRTGARREDAPRMLGDPFCFWYALEHDYHAFVGSFLAACDPLSLQFLLHGDCAKRALRSRSVNVLAMLCGKNYRGALGTTDWRGDTCLHEAAERGFPEVCGVLLHSGFSVHAQNTFGETPLLKAAAWGHESVCRALVARGAEVDAGASEGKTALIRAAEEGHTKSCSFLLLECGTPADVVTSYGTTALHVAAERGHWDVCNLLVSADANVNVASHDGATALVKAALRGHESVCDLLLDNGARTEDAEEDGRTALFRAVEESHDAVCCLLLERGASVNAAMKDGTSPLHVAAKLGYDQICLLLIDNGAEVNNTSSGNSPLHYAATLGQECVCRLLLDRGANVNAPTHEGNTALHLAAANGFGTICHLLLERGAEANAQNSKGRTPLCVAAQFGQEDVCRLLAERDGAAAEEKNRALLSGAQHGRESVCRVLLERGADVNCATSQGKTPLMLAAHRGDDAVCRLLLERGAAGDAVAGDGSTALTYAAGGGREGVCGTLVSSGCDVAAARVDGSTALHCAAEKGHRAVCVLLLDAGAAVDAARADGKTALVRAAEEGREAVCQLLVERGADVDRAVRGGKTALLGAARQGHKAICRLLLAGGARVNAATADGRTALFRASEEGSRSICRLLLEWGADVNASTGDESTALLAAAEQGHERVCRLLLERGADVNAASSDGETALLRAAEAGHERACAVLLEGGAAVEAAACDGETPLLRAARGLHADVCRQLLRAGAAAGARSDAGETALHLVARALEVQGEGRGDAGESDEEEEEEDEVFEGGAWMQRSLAAERRRNSRLSVCRVLLDAGADPTALDERGESACAAAARAGLLDLYRALCAGGREDGDAASP